MLSRVRGRSPQQRRPTVVPSEYACFVLFTPQGELVTYEGIASHMALPEGRLNFPQRLHGPSLFTPEGRLVVVHGGHLQIWEGPPWKLLRDLGQTGWPRYLAQAGPHLVLANHNQLARFSLEDGSREELVNGFAGALAVSPDGREMVANVGFGLIRTSWEDWQKLSRPGLAPGVTALDWNQGQIVSADLNGCIRLYCDQSMALLDEWRGPKNPRDIRLVPGGVAVLGDHLHFYSCGPSARAGLLGPRTLVVEGRNGYQVELPEEVVDWNLSADGRLLLVVTQQASTLFWRGRKVGEWRGQVAATLLSQRIFIDQAQRAELYAIGPPLRLLQAWIPSPVRPSGLEGDVWVDRLPAQLRAAISGDGRRVAIRPDLGGSVVIWDADSARPLSTVEAGHDRLALSCQGEFLVTGGSESLRVVDAKTGRLLGQSSLVGPPLCSPTCLRVAVPGPRQVDLLTLPDLTPLAQLPTSSRPRCSFNDRGELRVREGQRDQVWDC